RLGQGVRSPEGPAAGPTARAPGARPVPTTECPVGPAQRPSPVGPTPATADRPGPVQPSADLAAQALDPLAGLAPAEVGITATGRALLAGRRVGAEELHVLDLRLQLAEAVGHDLVADVPVEVDHEAVVAEPLLRRAGLELGQVDGPSGELLQ